MNIKALTRSTIATIVLIVFMTVIAELSIPFKTLLANLAGHHWTAKGVISLAFFAITYFALSMTYKNDGDVKKETYYVASATVICGLVIFFFFVWEYFK